MRSHYNIVDHASELSPDVEWMLQSGQVSLTLLVETLVETHYSKLLRLALMVLDDRRAAREVVRDTFLRAVLDLHHYRSQLGIENWLFKKELKKILRVKRRERIWHWLEKTFRMPGELTERWAVLPPTELDKTLWMKVDGLQAEARTLILLSYACDWSSSKIAEVVGMDPADVEAQIVRSLADLEREIPEAAGKIEALLPQSFEARYPLVRAEENELRSLARRVELRAGKGVGLRGKMVTVKEMAVIGVAILLVALIIWGGNRYFLKVDSSPSHRGVEGGSGLILPGDMLPNGLQDHLGDFMDKHYQI